MDTAPEKKKSEADKKRLFFGDKGTHTRIPNVLFSRGRYLTPQAKWIYATLQSFWNYDSGQIFPSYPKIMERSGLTRPAISKALKELEHFGWIIKQRRFSKSTDYDLVDPELSIESRTDKEWYCCPTKQQAVDWRKAQAQNRKSRKKKIWEKRVDEGADLDIICDEDIPF